MRRFAILALLVCSPAAVGAQQPAVADTLPSVALPPALERVLRDYERAWEGGDVTALVGLFTEDGFVPSRQGWRRGGSAIREQYAGAGGPLRLRAHAYAVQDSVGYIIGAYRYGELPGGGKFILALRRAPDGRWLIAADLDSGNRPDAE
jgi:ketosteroid isomerase-like protein